MVFNNNLLIGAASASAVTPSAGYTIDNSCIFNADDSSYLYRTPGSAGNGQLFTISVWLKLSNVVAASKGIIGTGNGAVDEDAIVYANITNTMRALIDTGTNEGLQRTVALYRDPTAWYHFVFRFETTSAVAGNRIRMYKNGVLQDQTVTNQISQSFTTAFNSTAIHGIGCRSPAGTPEQFFNGYMAEFIMIDGQSLAPSSFGEFNSDGVWIPVDPSALTFGTNGFWLDFEDNSSAAALGNDVSGNDNDFSVSGLATSDQTTDTPTDSGTTIGNYCTINPVDSTDANSLVLTNGNLEYAYNTAMKENACTIVIPAGTGTWRWEWDPDAPSNSYDPFVAIITKSGWLDRTADASPQARINVYAWGMNVQATSGIRKVHDNTFVLTSLGTYSTGGIIGFFVDAVNGELFANYDGGTPESLYSGLQTTEDWYILVSNGAGAAGRTPSVNFGQKAYAFSAPSGYEDYINVLTSNLAAPSITKPTDQFLPILYEGNGAGQRVGNFIPFTDTFAVGASARCDADADYMTKTFGSSTDAQRRTWSLSLWFKVGTLGGKIFYSSRTGSGHSDYAGLNSSDLLYWTGEDGTGDSFELKTNRTFKATDGWTHVLFHFDSTGATPGASDIYMAVNGVIQVTADLATETYPNQNFETDFLSTTENVLFSWTVDKSDSWDGYIAEVVCTAGTAYAASSFGETDTSTNRWIPKDPSGLTFGANGFYLDFADGNDLGDDESGNGNDWTEAGFDTTNGSNQMYGTPSQNFAVYDPSNLPGSTTLTQGNLAFTTTSGSWRLLDSGVGIPDSGTWYWETLIESISSANFGVGFLGISYTADLGADVYGWGYQSYNGTIKHGGSEYTYGATYTSGDVIGCAYNADTKILYFSKNGNWSDGAGNMDVTDFASAVGFSGVLADTGSGPLFIFNGLHTAGTATLNTGQWRYFDGATLSLDSDAGGYFRYTAPTDYLALQQDNYPASTAGITGFSWIKNRDASDPHILQNSVEGIYNYMSSNDHLQQITNTNSVQRFLQQGVQIGNMDAVNTSAESFVLWQWANDGGAGSVNGDGDTDITLAVNSTAGFSYGLVTSPASGGFTVGHGLGVQPSFVIQKNTNADNGWNCWHKNLTNETSYYLNLYNTDAEASSTVIWNNTAPTTSVMSANADWYGASRIGLWIFFAQVEGYSSFGSYVGNQDNDGPYVFLGFAPTWVMIKESDAAGSNWHIWDNKRRTYNPNTLDLNADLPNAEGYNNADIDLLASGFKIRTVGTGTNESGKTYIYAAFAENPFGGSGVAQARAR